MGLVLGGAPNAIFISVHSEAYTSADTSRLSNPKHRVPLKGRMELTTEGAALLAPRLRERSLSSMPSDYCPTTEAECEQILREAVVLLKTNQKSGYAYVFPISGRKPWQAKPYIWRTRMACSGINETTNVSISGLTSTRTHALM